MIGLAATLVAFLVSPVFIDVKLAQAAPTDPDIALAQQFAPQFKFHKDEIYWPSTVDFFLGGAVKVVDTNGNVVASSVTPQTLDDTPSQGSGLFINTDINAGKAAGGLLRGQNPANSSPDVNTFVVHKANGVIDIFYWLFTPFNSAKSVPIVGQVGDHVGDWERLTVRTVNGAPTQVSYNAHSNTGSTLPWAQVPKFDNNTRPVAYIAYGSHGTWPSVGTFTYVDAVIFKLQDVTTDGGVAWDTRSGVRTLLYPDTYTGASEWLNYKGAWGNKGNTDCWWYVFHNECQVVTGPTGPLRGDVLGAANVGGSAKESVMDGPADHTLGTPSQDSESSYTIRLAPGAQVPASNKIGVQQTCVLKVESKEGEEKKDDIITTIVGFAATSGKTVTISVPACVDTEGFIASYTIGLCQSDSEACNWASQSRIVHAFHANPEIEGFGVQEVKAIVVDDLDDWEL